MKKALLLLILLLSLPFSAYALGGVLPFGGRIVTTHVPPNVICPGDPTGSPFTIVPVGTVPAGPWSATFGLVNIGVIAPSGWTLGLYRPSSECVMGTGPGATPYPTFQTDFYGTSIPKAIPFP